MRPAQARVPRSTLHDSLSRRKHRLRRDPSHHRLPATVKTENEIKSKLSEIEKDYGHLLTSSVATVAIYAPRALEQIAAETKLQTLHWVLGTKYKSKLK